MLQQKKSESSLIKLLKKAPKKFWEISLVQFFTWIGILYSWTYATGAISLNVWQTSDPSAFGYQEAGNWFGVLTCIQSIAGVLWGLLIQSHTKSSSRKFWYRFGLCSGGIGFLMVFFIHNKYVLIIPFILIGIMYLVINTQPFSLLTESLDGKHDGAYLGLFNCSICLPQIVASIVSFWIFTLVGESMPAMFLVGGVCVLVAAYAVRFIHLDE